MNLELLEELATFEKDPYAFVLWAFPWEKDEGPEPWQREVLCEIRDSLKFGDGKINIARTSGHGIGKSALVSWLILWAISTRENTRGVITANTENQLRTKTWAELSIWYSRFIAKDLFEFSPTRIRISSQIADETLQWEINMIPWSKHNTEAFAGLHNKGNRILLVMDEASAIIDAIWEVAEGALTDANTQIIWAAFGNPTRNSGRFRECFDGGRFSHRWSHARVDSREVSFTDKKKIGNWIDDYGLDSDFVRVRVLGLFPRVDSESFIPLDLAKGAAFRVPEPSDGLPLILGVDVSRFGDDPSVIAYRRGNDATTLPWEVYFGIDTQSFASKIALAFESSGAQVVMIDEGGVGGGVMDRLRVLNIPTLGVDFSRPPDNFDANNRSKYANKRAEIWDAMRQWLHKGSIPERVQSLEMTLPEELSAPRYGLNGREAIQLENKKDMRRRGVKSPNLADALACTFAFPVYMPSYEDRLHEAKMHELVDYNPFEEKRIYEPA